MTTDLRETHTVPPNVWTDIPDTGLQVFHSSGHNVAVVVASNGQVALGSGNELADWRVRLAPTVHNELADARRRDGDEQPWLGDALPALLLVEGELGQQRVITDLTAPRHHGGAIPPGGRIPWDSTISDRAIAISEAMIALASERLREVRRARQAPPAP